MNSDLGKRVQDDLASLPKDHAASCFSSLTKHSFFAMLKKTKGNP